MEILFAWLVTVSSAQINQLHDVFLKAFLPQNLITEEQLTDYFNTKVIPRLHDDDMLYVAMDGDAIVAFVIFQEWEPNVYYLAELAVNPDYQGKGIGKTLVFSILDQDPNTHKILLVTNENNSKAHSFYEALGFQRSPFEHSDYPEDYVGFEYHQDAPAKI